MFVLGIIAQVLRTAIDFQQIQSYLDLCDLWYTAGNVWSSYRINVVIGVHSTITRLMVRLHDASMLSA